MKNLILRTVTGVLFVALLVGCILGGPLSFIGLFSLITVLTAWELTDIITRHTEATPVRMWSVFGTLIVFITFVTWSLPHAGSAFSAVTTLAPYALLFVLCFLTELANAGSAPLQTWSYTLFTHLYVGLPFGLLYMLGLLGGSSLADYDPTLPLAIFVFLWVNDTGAYCTGSLLHNLLPAKLAPNISPNKTWIGSTGGCVLCLASAAVVWHFTDILSLPVWLGLAFVVCVAGTIGDLAESLLKRRFGLKDSGKLLPGHGGMLDRLDSALMAIPAAACYLGFIHSFTII